MEYKYHIHHVCEMQWSRSKYKSINCNWDVKEAHSKIEILKILNGMTSLVFNVSYITLYNENDLYRAYGYK